MIKHRPSLIQSLIPILFLIAMLILNVRLYGDGTLGGANQMALLFSGAVASIIAIYIGQRWDDIFSGIIKSIYMNYNV